MSESRPNPYVGPRPFELGETLYGRNSETHALMDLLIAERIVLLHSPSGAGKTSLLQAALLPRLKQRRFNVLPIMRVNRKPHDGDANRYIQSVLTSLEDGLPEVDRLDEAAVTSLSLPEYLNRRAERFGRADSQTLILDQFEEVLSIDPTDRMAKEAFFAQLGEALLDRRRWALFAIREDYMGGLAPFVRLLPTQLSNTFRLDLLDAEAARSAIKGPAREKGVEFTDKAADRLVENLMQGQTDDNGTPQPGLYVEPVQLQVVCLRMWDRLPADASQIVESDVIQVGQVDDALAEYYAERVGMVAAETKASERTIREWFDRHLITEQGVRSQVLQKPNNSGGLANTAIELFIQAHIVRAEVRRGATWFELTHDRLIKPIVQNNNEWYRSHLSALQRQAELWNQQSRRAGYLLSGQALVEVEEWARVHPDELTQVEKDFLNDCREALARAERERRQNLLIRWLALGALLLFFAAVIAAGCAVDQSNNAKAQAGIANAQRATAQAEADARAIAQATAVADRDAAQRAKRISDSHRLSAQSTLARREDFARALLLGVEALRPGANPDVLNNLVDALASHPQLKTYLREYEGQVQGRVQAVTFSPDGKILASGSTDGKIVFWDVNSGKSIAAPLTGHTNTVYSLAFSPDGRTVASGSADTTVRLWDVDVHQPIGEPLAVHKASVWCVAFSPDGKLLASSSNDRSIILWDVQTRQRIGEPLTTQGGVYGVAFSPDGKLLASADNTGSVILWDLSTHPPLAQPLPGHATTAYSVAFTPDGKLLASGSNDKSIILWDVKTRQSITPPLLGHTDSVRSVVFSPDGRFLVSGSDDKTIMLWDVSTHEPIGEPLTGHTANVNSVAASPGGQLLASGSYDTTIILWDLSADHGLSSLRPGHTDNVRSITFDRDGNIVAARVLGDTIRLWDLNTDQPIGVPLSPGAALVTHVAFSPDGKLLVSAGAPEMTIRLWDANSRQPIGSPISGITAPVASVAVSDDAKVAWGTMEGTIFLWDENTHQTIGTLTGHNAPISSLVFSFDGKQLASRGFDNSLRLWNLSSGPPTGVIISESMNPVGGIAFSPDGKMLATGETDGTVRLWDALARQPISSPLSRNQLSVTGIAYSPDGKQLASASADGTHILWNVDPNSWLALACRIANRNLTPVEWAQYIDPDPSTYRATCPF